MIKIFSLFFVLNRQSFFRYNLLFSEFSPFFKNLFFSFYLFIRFLTWIMLASIGYFAILNVSNPLPYILICQIVILLSAILIFSKQAVVSDQKLNSLLFLTNNLFNRYEKNKNISYVVAYYQCIFASLIILVNTIIIKYYVSMNFFIVLTGLWVAILSMLYTNFFLKRAIKRNNLNNTIEANNGMLTYVSLSIITIFLIIYVTHYKVRVQNIIQVKYLVLLLIILSTYMVFKIIFKDSNLNIKGFRYRNNIFNGIHYQYFKQHIEKSASLIFGTGLFLHIIPASHLSRGLIMIASISFFFIPNILHLKMLNFIKIINMHKNTFLKNYILSFIPFLILVVFVEGIISNIGFIGFVISSISIPIILLIRYTTAVKLVNSRLSDSKKADYNIFISLATIMIILFFAYITR